MGETTVGAVEGLYRYPVKSMRGERRASLEIGPLGVLGDRGYAVVDADDGTVASAKDPRKWAGLLDFRATYTGEPAGGAPLPPVTIEFPDGSTRRSDDVDIDTALSDVLGRRVRLSSVPDPEDRYEAIWPDWDGDGGVTPQAFLDATTVGREPGGEARTRLGLGPLAPEASFFDLDLLHLVTTSTLRRLSALAPDTAFAPERYRPNVLVATAGDGFVEDDWVDRVVRIGPQASAAVSMLTMRCVMTTLAQGDLPADRDVLRTPAKHHRLDIRGSGRWACAGVYAGVAAGGRVTVGDAVITETGSAPG